MVSKYCKSPVALVSGMNPPISEMSQTGLSAQDGLCIPEPDKENITVLSSELPNSPILPWHHFDSPWIAEDAESAEASADAAVAEESSTEAVPVEECPASPVEALETASGEPAPAKPTDSDAAAAMTEQPDSSTTVLDVVVEPSQETHQLATEQPAVTLIIPPPDLDALLIDQPPNHHDSAA